jgi:hypothetical protein
MAQAAIELGDERGAKQGNNVALSTASMQVKCAVTRDSEAAAAASGAAAGEQIAHCAGDCR